MLEWAGREWGGLGENFTWETRSLLPPKWGSKDFNSIHTASQIPPWTRANPAALNLKDTKIRRQVYAQKNKVY